MTRTFRRLASFVAASALALAQLAVSAYACPMLAPSEDAAAIESSMPDCPDVGTTNLCDQHCDYGSTSVDTQPSGFANVAVVPVTWRIAQLPVAEISHEIRDWRLERSTYPPPPILFGILRI